MRLIFGFVILVLSSSVLGVDFGKQAATYEVAEEGFVAMVKSRLAAIDLQQYQEEMRTIATKKVLEPEPVLGIRATNEPREFWYDPSLLVTEDIKLPDGKVLHKAGTKVNPLDHMDFDRELIFIDGRSSEQIEWLKQRLKMNKQKKEVDNNTQEDNTQESRELGDNLEIRIILVGGKILELQEDIGRTLYFDQAGELTSKFGIEQVPALVVQDGKKLKIREIKI
nr:conjugal transfer protein TraW [Rickettsia endosymbiont of Ixodes pacificus]